jgi:Domain of unknown function (DUF4267)
LRRKRKPGEGRQIVNVFVDVLTIVIGALVIFIGARFLLQPRSAAAGYGVPADPSQPGTGAYLTIKGVRDGIYGVVTLVLLFTASHHVLAWFLLATAVLPLADMLIVLRHGGSKAVAFGIHFATALVMLLDVALLLA